MYFVDLVALSFVSWMAIIAGFILMDLIRSWMFGSAMFKEAAFQDII